MGTFTPTLLVIVVALLNGADTTAFGCENTLITDKWREMILTFNNEKREIVAMGKQADKSGKYLPEAKEMYKLEWDCNIEMIAHEALTNCTTIPESGLEVNGVGLDFREGIISEKKDFDVLTETKQLLNAWYNEVKQNDIPDPVKWNAAYHNFAIFIRDDAKGMACTYTTACGGGTKMLCVYRTPKNNLRGALYLKGPTCSNCGNDTCIKGLCVPQEYTPLPVPGDGGADGMTKNMRITAQNMHNYYRRLLATGWARNKQTVYAPIAAKMKFVTYDEQGLGQEANNKSSDCRAKIGDPSPGRAMNIEEIGDYNMLLQDALEMAITKWWRQVETEGIPTDLKYTEAMANAGKITKFVNMANENIDSVGCAVTRCLPIGKIRVVCEYNTVPGVDEVVYTKAAKKPCSGCAQIQKTCGTHYSEGLCV